MAELLNVPGVRINEIRLDAPAIAGVSTSTPGFVGQAPKAGAFSNVARLVTSFDQFQKDYIAEADGVTILPATTSTEFSHALVGYFKNGGGPCYVVNAAPAGVVDGINLLAKHDDIQIIAAPGSTSTAVSDALKTQAEDKRDRFAILDAPAKADNIIHDLITPGSGKRPADSMWTALYYPRIQVPPYLPSDPQPTPNNPNPIYIAPTGHIAGVYGTVDALRGVHKAPANVALLGAIGVEDILVDGDQDVLNREGVNAIRLYAAGPTIWGTRTLLAHTEETTFRYLNIRRLTTYVEQSLRVGLRFAVFEPNNLPLRQQISRSVRAFLDGVWRDGALFGASAEEAYYVRFPDAFNTDDDRAQGKLTIEIGIRVSYPAEFIIIRIGLLLHSASAA
jgi:uncharacterized protein